MVEMLGVLAIIGVLSVGAIAGYQKAMFKYRLNKQSESLSHLFAIMTKYKSEWHLGYSLNNLIPYYRKLGEIPEDMLKSGNSYLKDVFNNQIILQTNNCPGDHPCDETLLSYQMTKQTNYDLCHNLFEVAIPYAQHLMYFTVNTVNNTNQNAYLYRYYGESFCTKSKNNCISQINMENIYNICQACSDKKSCSFIFIWKI